LRITKCSRLKQISNLNTIEILDLSYSKLNDAALHVFFLLSEYLLNLFNIFYFLHE
jgi:hypothetical protein